MVRRRSSSLDRGAGYASGGPSLASTVTSSLSSYWSKSSGGAGIYGAGNTAAYDYSAKSGIVSGVEPLSRTYLGSRAPILRHHDTGLDLNGSAGFDPITASTTVSKYKYDMRIGNGRSSSAGGGFRAYAKPEIPNFPADDEDEVDIRRRVRQKFKKAYSAEPDSIPTKRRVITGRTSDMVRMRDRMEQKVRTSSSVDRDYGPWESDGSAQVRGRTREVYSYQINQPWAPPPPPLQTVEPRALSVEPMYYSTDLDPDAPSTRLNVVPVHILPPGLTRVPVHTVSMTRTSTPKDKAETIRRGLRRARSVSDLDVDEGEYDIDFKGELPRKRIAKKLIPNKVPARSLAYEAPVYVAPYTDRDVNSVRGDYRFHISELEKDRRKGDISTYVLPHDEKFEPDSIDVRPMGEGKKQVTYSRQTLSGHASDPREAKAALDNVVRRTRFMHDSMSELEKFVRRNRSLFPEDTTIYQEYKFYLLSEEELLKIGEKPDAEVYGVKIIEKLVVPAGTEVAHLLKRFYGEGEVQVEYSRRRKGEPVEDESGLVDDKYLKDDMRRKVELEYESKERNAQQQAQSRYLPTYQSPIVRDVDFRDYAHLYTRIGPRHMKKIYGEPAEG